MGLSMIEAAALATIRAYYRAHQVARATDAAGLRGPCHCESCVKAETYFSLTGYTP